MQNDNNFINDNFLLKSKESQNLYNYIKDLPIYDYHSHINAKDIALNNKYEDISELWLKHDHYKWRLMRTNGISEDFCTGRASNKEKFLKWALTVAYAIKNPLFHWTHLELKRFFDIDLLLTPETSEKIYNECNDKLKSEEYRPVELLKKMKVNVLCTTDDITDDLYYHKIIKDKNYDIKVFPTFRPDKLINIEFYEIFKIQIEKLENILNININNFNDFIFALSKRIDYFDNNGCQSADHGLENMSCHLTTENDVNKIFKRALKGKILSTQEILKYKSTLLYELAKIYNEKKWVMQLHIGALRNNNSSMYGKIGPDTGFDSIGCNINIKQLLIFLDKLNNDNNLCKTIIYNINPGDFEIIASMINCFQDDSYNTKMQLGPAWWFLDNKDYIINQIVCLSNSGLLSGFIGMTTDSRSLLSLIRHEYFRRILCNFIGNDIDDNVLPKDYNLIKEILCNICFNNADRYFKKGK